MLYAVTIEPIKATFFLGERPDAGSWEVQEGVDLDVPSNLYSFPDGGPSPLHILTRSKENPKHYKVFKYRDDIASSGFQATGMTFGGVYSMPAWERLMRDVLPGELRLASIPDDRELLGGDDPAQES